MILDDEMQERFRDFFDACAEFVKAFTEQAAEAMEIFYDAIRQAADIVAERSGPQHRMQTENKSIRENRTPSTKEVKDDAEKLFAAVPAGSHAS